MLMMKWRAWSLTYGAHDEIVFWTISVLGSGWPRESKFLSHSACRTGPVGHQQLNQDSGDGNGIFFFLISERFQSFSRLHLFPPLCLRWRKHVQTVSYLHYLHLPPPRIWTFSIFPFCFVRFDWTSVIWYERIVCKTQPSGRSDHKGHRKTFLKTTDVQL